MLSRREFQLRLAAGLAAWWTPPAVHSDAASSSKKASKYIDVHTHVGTIWNGNKEPWSNLYSFDPKKSIIAWSATRHGVYRRRYGEAEDDPRWAGLRFVRLRSQREADAFLAGVTVAATKEE